MGSELAAVSGDRSVRHEIRATAKQSSVLGQLIRAELDRTFVRCYRVRIHSALGAVLIFVTVPLVPEQGPSSCLSETRNAAARSADQVFCANAPLFMSAQREARSLEESSSGSELQDFAR